MDSVFAEACVEKAKERGLQARTVNYDAFPIDTGSITALSLLNPENRIPATIVSSNMYANRSETIVLGKAIRDALTEEKGKHVVWYPACQTGCSPNPSILPKTEYTARRTMTGIGKYWSFRGRTTRGSQPTIKGNPRSDQGPESGCLQASVVDGFHHGPTQQLRWRGSGL